MDVQSFNRNRIVAMIDGYAVSLQEVSAKDHVVFSHGASDYKRVLAHPRRQT